ncbi:MAG: alpha/beta hydrolase [Pseudomonadota bacterium]
MKPFISMLIGVAALSAGCASVPKTMPRPVEPAYPLAPLPPYVTPETPQGKGAFPALMEVDPGLATHTVYRPANLAALGATKLPILAWGNGGCVNIGNRFRYFLTEIASHGFIGIANGPIVSRQAEEVASSSMVKVPPAPGSPAALQVSNLPEGQRPAATTAKQLIDAIDWAIAENARPASKYFGRIDTSKIAVMGQSCGGLQAIDAAHDPRVTTLGVWNSGAFPADGRAYQIAAANADKATLQTLHGSAIYITGAPTDVAFPNAMDDFDRINHIPVFHGWREQTGHTGVYREPNGGEYGEAAVAWLKWQLKGDQTAARMFSGADCGMCKKPNWHVKSKRIEAVK